MDDSVRISIASDFSETPFGRYYEDGDETGQRFREELLLPALESGKKVVIDIDNVAGLPSSFWEEALGGAVRSGLSAEDLRERLTIETTQSDLRTYVRIGWMHIDRAEQEMRRSRV